MSCCKQWGKKKKQRLQPQCQSTKTQPLLLVFHVHAITPNSSEPPPHSPRTRLLDQPAVLASGLVLSMGHPMRGLGAGAGLGKAEPGCSACPYACLRDHPSTSTSTGICQCSPPTQCAQAPFPKILLQEDQYLWKPRFQMPFHRLLPAP